jgi:CheY-like chemotaxis protein
MNGKPIFRVGVYGLELRDVRLIEIVFKHSQYNKYEFRRAETETGAASDLLVLNLDHPQGSAAAQAAAQSARQIPVIAVVARGAQSNARHAISIDRLTLQLLPILNRVIELEFGEALAQAAAAQATPAAPTPFVPTTSVSAAPQTRLDDFVDTQVMAQAMQETEPRPRVQAPNQFPNLAALEAAAAQGMNERASSSFSPNPVDTLYRGAPLDSAAARIAAGLPPAAERHTEPQLPRLAERVESPAAAKPAAPLKNLVKFPSPEGAQQRLRALVVDDSPTVRQQLCAALGKMGLHAESVASAREALDTLATQHFDIALFDVVMPEMDGYKLTREVKKNRALRSMPVVILTSKSSPFDLARGALAGCDTYLTKPVPLKQLEAALVKLLRKSLAIDDLSQLMRLSPLSADSAGQKSFARSA